MAELIFEGETIQDPAKISAVMTEFGMKYETWGTRGAAKMTPAEVLTTYADEIAQLKSAGGYVSQDVVALDSTTPNLEALLAKFDKEHHHTEDEVRFVVDGEGVFELESTPNSGRWLKMTMKPGDLIVVPAGRRHLFYLTDKTSIRCIRLFQTQQGWEAIYEKNS